MNKKIWIALMLTAVAAIIFLSLRTKQAAAPATTVSPDRAVLSADQKSIAIRSSMLEIDSPAIIAFLRDPKTGLCDAANIHNTPTRTAFCSDTAALRESIHFLSVASSPGGNAIAFTIATNELSPDTAIGMYFPKNTTYKVHFLTNYYLGNAIISFSPSGTYFAYAGNCFEGVCSFAVVETNTLKTVREFSNPETQPASTFVRWIDNKTIEYKEGGTTKRAAL
ncbi:MAG: hypothetical protein V4478_02635 [Patescibacteria group bacterium]